MRRLAGRLRPCECRVRPDQGKPPQGGL